MAPTDVRKKIDQIRRNKNKSKPGKDRNVKDLRQIISKRSKTNERSPNRIGRDRITTRNRPNSTGPRDLRDTNRRLATRKAAVSQPRVNTSSNTRSDKRFQVTTFQVPRTAPVVNKRTLANGQIVKIGKKVVQQQQYYVPPHMQRNQPTYIIAPAAAPKSNLAMDSINDTPQGASVLISNLKPSITQSDIIELFGDIGVLTAVNIINQTTALVTYQNSSDAVRAVKVYHNRLLDGSPMLVNMMPNSV